jgi:drug/metabolite transporter (DMT)-like permease
MAGIGLTILAYFVFAFHDAMVKLLVADIAVWQILFFRSVVVVSGALAFGRRPLVARALTTPLRWKLAMRGLVLLAAFLSYYSAARDLPLGELMTLYFASPIVVTVLAIPLLGERVTLWRWIAVLIGFAGVVVACDPTGFGLSLATVLVLAAACLWALATILIRMIALHESALLQMLYGNTVYLVATGAALAFVWVPPSPAQFAMMLAVGAVGGVAQLALFEGMRRGQASVLAPFEYTALIWAFVLGFLVWGDVPRTEVVIGAVLILAAGLIMMAAGRKDAPIVP